jgi:hypothetical protein
VGKSVFYEKMSNPAPVPPKTATLFERFSDNAHHIIAGTTFSATGSLALTALTVSCHLFTHALPLPSFTGFCTSLGISMAYGAYTGLQTRKDNLNKNTGLSNGFTWAKETLPVVNKKYEAPAIDFTLPRMFYALGMGLLLTGNSYIFENLIPSNNIKNPAQEKTAPAPVPRPFAFVPH